MAEPVSNIRINSDRLWDMLMDMAKIGPGVAGGNNRQALTDADADGRQLFADWCHAEGLTMDVDELGNMFMTAQARIMIYRLFWWEAILIHSQQAENMMGFLGFWPDLN